MNFRRNDDLSGLTVGSLGERLQRFQLNHRVTGVGVIEQANGVCGGLLHRLNSRSLTLGLANFRFFHSLGVENGRLLFCLCFQDLGLLVSLGHQNTALLLALGGQDGLAALALRFHLLFHSVLNFPGRDNVFQLHPVHLNTPGVRGLVQNHPDLGVDGVAGSEGAVQLHLADNITQRGGRQILNGRNGAFHTVGVQLGVRDLEEHHRVDLHGHIVLGDHRLRLKVNNLLLKRNGLGNPVNERNFYMQTGLPGGVESAQPLQNECLGLGHYTNVGQHQRNQRQNDHS